MRAGCATCGGSMEGKKSHAIYCDRKCKNKASDLRRRESMTPEERYSFDHGRYLKERDRRLAYQAKYHQQHREENREIRLRRKGRLLESDRPGLTSRDWGRLVARYRGECGYCGARAELQRDHIIPLSRGGSNHIGNIIPACARCNYAKKARLAADFRVRVLPHLLVV